MLSDWTVSTEDTGLTFTQSVASDWEDGAATPADSALITLGTVDVPARTIIAPPVTGFGLTDPNAFEIKMAFECSFTNNFLDDHHIGFYFWATEQSPLTTGDAMVLSLLYDDNFSGGDFIFSHAYKFDTNTGFDHNVANNFSQNFSTPLGIFRSTASTVLSIRVIRSEDYYGGTRMTVRADAVAGPRDVSILETIEPTEVVHDIIWPNADLLTPTSFWGFTHERRGSVSLEASTINIARILVRPITKDVP